MYGCRVILVRRKPKLSNATLTGSFLTDWSCGRAGMRGPDYQKQTKLRSLEKDRSVYGPVVEEIKELLKGFDDHSVRHVRRSCYGVAHILAKEGYENKLCNTWMGTAPEFAVNWLASDCAV